jgi:hypothetical protein
MLPPSLTISAAYSVVAGGTKARAVRWGADHQRVEQTLSSVVGPEGAVLSLPGSDFSLIIPAGALSAPTNITVISRGGAQVVYDMLPHGLKFSKPVVAVQSLRNTAVYNTEAASRVRSAYLPPDREQVDADDTASPSELEAATTYYYGDTPVAETQVWILNHFSRYILISGVWTVVSDVNS